MQPFEQYVEPGREQRAEGRANPWASDEYPFEISTTHEQ